MASDWLSYLQSRDDAFADEVNTPEQLAAVEAALVGSLDYHYELAPCETKPMTRYTISGHCSHWTSRYLTDFVGFRIGSDEDFSDDDDTSTALTDDGDDTAISRQAIHDEVVSCLSIAC